jgi:hypothetical protein
MTQGRFDQDQKKLDTRLDITLLTTPIIHLKDAPPADIICMNRVTETVEITNSETTGQRGQDTTIADHPPAVVDRQTSHPHGCRNTSTTADFITVPTGTRTPTLDQSKEDSHPTDTGINKSTTRSSAETSRKQ